MAIHTKGQADGRRVGAGHETRTGPKSLTVDRFSVPRHSIVGTHSSTLCPATCMICVVDDGLGRGSTALAKVALFFIYHINYIKVSCEIGGTRYASSICRYMRVCIPIPGCGEEKKKPGMCSYSTYALRSGVISIPDERQLLCRLEIFPIPGHGLLRVYLVQILCPRVVRSSRSVISTDVRVLSMLLRISSVVPSCERPIRDFAGLGRTAIKRALKFIRVFP